MKLTKLFTIAFILLAIGATTPLIAQTGGRKREHKNQRGGGGMIHRKKSGGHADAFAKGGKGGFFSRIFKKKKNGSAWVYHKTKPGIKQRKEQPKLFSRNRTKSKRFTDGVIAQQNRSRSKGRVRGNQSFSKKKH